MKKTGKAKTNLNNYDNPAKAKAAAKAFTDKSNVKTDPLGSWTGNPADPGDAPTQDVDDL